MRSPRRARLAGLTLTLAAVLATTAASAADPAFDPLDDIARCDTPPTGIAPWRADLALGLQVATGNTRAGTLTSRAALHCAGKGRDNRLDLSYVNAWARGSDADRKLAAGDQIKLDVGARHYAFALARYIKDDAAAVTRGCRWRPAWAPICSRAGTSSTWMPALAGRAPRTTRPTISRTARSACSA